MAGNNRRNRKRRARKNAATTAQTVKHSENGDNGESRGLSPSHGGSDGDSEELFDRSGGGYRYSPLRDCIAVQLPPHLQPQVQTQTQASRNSPPSQVENFTNNIIDLPLRKRSSSDGHGRRPPGSHAQPEKSPPSTVDKGMDTYNTSYDSEVIDDVFEDDEEAPDLVERIQQGIDYVRDQRRKREPVKQFIHFTVETNTKSAALDLLRQAHKDKYATIVRKSDTTATFEIGIPRPTSTEGPAFSSIHDPQWWVGKSQAEIKAGPWAFPEEIKKAEANLKGLKTKRKKKGSQRSQKERDIDWKLQECLRRQQLGLPMCDDDDEEMVEEDEEEEEDYEEENELYEAE